MKHLLLVTVLVLMTGCTTIYFDQDEPVAENPARLQSAWHHNMIWALIEVSEPVDLSATCGESSWDFAKTETSFLNGLIGFVPYLSFFWEPKTASVQCKS